MNASCTQADVGVAAQLVRRWQRYTARALWLSVSLAHTTGAQGRGGVKHPVDEYRVFDVKPNASLSLDQTSRAKDERFARTYLRKTSRWSIGVEDGAEEEVFGLIQDVAVNASDEVFVLDSRMTEVRVFSAEGRFVQKFSRAGRGPGELSNPKAIAVDADGRVYIGETGSKLHIFAPVAGKYKHVTDVALGVDPTDICIMHDTVYVAGAKFGAAYGIHAFDRQGRHLLTFGQVYRSPNALMNFQIAQGHIACNARDRIVYFVPSSVIGQVNAYSADGRALWITPFAGFRPISVIEYPDRSVTVTRPDDGNHRIARVLTDSDGSVIVQVMLETTRGHRGERTFSRIVTLKLDGRTGIGAIASEAVSPLALIASRYHLVQHDSLFPTLVRIDHEVSRR